MSDSNSNIIGKKISEASTRDPDLINLSRGVIYTRCKTTTHFDTDKSLINIPRQMLTKSNDLNIVNTNNSHNMSYSLNDSFGADSSKLEKTEREEVSSVVDVRRTFTEKNIYDEMNKAEKNIENME
jgi:hypothetical protein